MINADESIETAQESALYAKLTLRLVPLLFIGYVVAYLDRVNVGFAKLQMLQDLHFSDTVFGLGAGIFFIGYFLFEVPSNLALHRIGARIWITRIMITWGLISGLMIVVNTPFTFYLVRFLLGLAEAGFFPGIILYITYWFPARRRGRITTLFMMAVALSGVIGGPLSGWIMQYLPGVAGLAGWQWMFICEALPSVLVGVIIYAYLPDGVEQASWLSASEKQLLKTQIAAESSGKSEQAMSRAFANPRVWLMAVIYFCLVMGLYGIGFWLPTLIKASGVQKPLDIGMLTALPYATAAIVMVLVSHSADKRGERRWHVAIPALAGSLGLLLSTLFANDVWLAMAALTLGTAGIITSLPLFWSLPTAFLGGTAAAAGIALINSIGNLAGFVSPYLVGWLKDATHSTNSGMLALAVSLLLGAILTLTVPKSAVNEHRPTRR
jgi:D-galactonate transporter